VDVARGKADFLIGGVSTAELKQMRVHYRRQLHVEPLPPGTYFLFLDTTQPPFTDVRVRHALSYAIDRRHLVELAGGPAYGRPNCQIIPPNVPGWVPYCPYTLDPQPGGEWTAPDVATAQRLIAASGTRGQKVTVWWWRDHSAQGRYVAALLRRLGYRTRLKELKNLAAYERTVFNPKTRAQIGLFGWFGAHDGADALAWLSCGYVGDPARFCDRRIDREAAPEHLAQLQDIHLQRLPRRRRRLVSPERVDQPVTRHRPVRLKRE
jgi:peptide/nickel transport system substrate-binding protein